MASREVASLNRLHMTNRLRTMRDCTSANSRKYSERPLIHGQVRSIVHTEVDSSGQSKRRVTWTVALPPRTIEMPGGPFQR